MVDIPDKLNGRIMLPLFAVVAVDAIGVGVILPLLPFYSRHFGASPFMIGVLLASFSLCQFIASPWLGKLSDRHGRKPVLLGSQLGTCFALVLLASAQSLWLVFAARMIDGLTAGNLSVASAYAVDNSTPATRKQAIGIVAAAIGVGVMVGPALSALLVRISITAPIWAAAVLSGCSILSTLILLPRNTVANVATKPPAARLAQTLQMPGTLAVLTALGAFSLAFSMYISQFALFMSARFEWNGHPFGPGEVGLLFTLAGAINIFVQLFAMKRISRIVPENGLAVSSLGLVAAGYAGLALSASVPALVAAVVIASLGTALARPTLTAALTLTAAPGQQGALMGLNTSTMALANVAGPLLAGLLIGRGWYTGWALSIALLVAATMLAVQLLVVRGRWTRANRPATQL